MDLVREITSELAGALAVVVAALLSVALREAARWLRGKTALDKVLSETAQEALIIRVVGQAADYVEQRARAWAGDPEDRSESKLRGAVEWAQREAERHGIAVTQEALEGRIEAYLASRRRVTS